VIVLHDVDLVRMAGDLLRAQDATLAQIQAVDLGQGERVPVLDAAMELVLEHGAPHARSALLNVEIKPDVPDAHALVTAVVACIAARPAEQRARVIVSSFSAPICQAVHDACPELAVAFLFERLDLLPDPTMDARDAAGLPGGASAAHPHHALLDAAGVAQLRARFRPPAGQAERLIVNTWTVNDPQRAVQLAAAGVDGIITDDVPAILAALASQA
jgi:glycerophosphoryl diester phosphodiesterase